MTDHTPRPPSDLPEPGPRTRGPVVRFARDRGRILVRHEDGAHGQLLRTPSGPVVLWRVPAPDVPPSVIAQAFDAWSRAEIGPPHDAGD